MHAAASGFEFGRSRIEALVDAKENGWSVRLAVSARRVMSRRDRLAGQRSKGSLRNRGNAFLGSLNLSQKGKP